MERIIYFQAGPVATTEELAEIAAINAFSVNPYQVLVMNGSASTSYGAGNITADYVAGTIPTAYNEFDVFDYENPPDPVLIATKATVTDESVLDTDDGGTVTFTVEANEITAAAYAASATKILLSTGAVIPITAGGTGTVTLTVAGGVITAAVYAA